jgi:DNA-binding NarL/FixJ family response regulator
MNDPLHTMTKIYIIDRHPISRNGLKLLLQDIGNNLEILEGYSLEDLFTKNSTTSPDILLLATNTLSLKSIDNYPILGRISATTKIIVYDDNEKTDSTFFRYCFNTLGVKGYIPKHCSLTEFRNCFNEVATGAKYIESQIAIELILNHPNHESQKKKHFRKIALSRGELKVAQDLCAGKRTSQIAAETGRKPSTISTIKANVFRKMAVKNVIDLRLILQND